MALWPNNYIRSNSPYKQGGLMGYYKYQALSGGTQNLFTCTQTIPKRTSHPNGYGMLSGIIKPITAGGMSAYTIPVSTETFTGALIQGGPMEGTGDMTFTGDNQNLSLVISMDGTSTITFTADNNVLALTIGLDGSGAWTLTGDNNALALIVPFEGSGNFVLTGTSDLRGKLSMTGEWTPFSELSPENLARAVWEEVLALHLTPGSTGNALNAAGAAGDPWSTTLPGAYTGSQAGAIMQNVKNNTNIIPALL